ncbi:MAG: recombinase family protein [Candidatus Sericytochromatia bacterium]|uniref:Recombinase family protein n=1 Tax=Candidatus Tanganyikabacteria bacterium TaxID=2961651 RepID=A0A937X9J4_9BACT|nr:recombinase family protein [Candidatus Tanganyikabacteria bacterium]
MASVIGYIWINPQETGDASKIALQHDTLKAYCAANGLDLADVRVEEGTPGAALERPVMRDLVANDKTSVIVTSLISLGRRFHDVATVLSEFSHKEIRLISVEENVDTGRPEGMQLLKVLVKIPQVAGWIRAPKEVPSNRVFVRAREVLHNGGTCPYGYTLDEASNQFVANPVEAQVVQRIFRERSAGRSLRQIANDLTRDGIATKRGGRWQANTVKTILENLFYTGDYQCQNRIYEQDHEAVISKELFREVNTSHEILQVV